MKITKAIQILEDRRDWLIEKAREKPDSFNFYIREACAQQVSIEALQEKADELRNNGESSNVRFYHPDLEDLRAAQAAESRAFRKMESNTI